MMIKTQQHFSFFYHISIIVILALLCIAIYSNTLDVPFVFDDWPNISENQSIRLTDFNLTKLHEAAFNSPNYARPIANLSFAINYYFWEYDVTGYHITNIAIHLINGILVYFIIFLTICVSIIKGYIKTYNDHHLLVILSSAIAAAIFIAHPLQTQSVTYIVQRMNSMGAMFYLLSLLLFILARTSQLKWKCWALWSCCFISWIFALCTKQTSITLPIIILLYEWYIFQDLKTEWIKKNSYYFIGVFFMLLSISYIYLGADPLHRIFQDYNIREFTVGERMMTQFRVIVFYFSLVLIPLPSRLNLLHDFPVSYSLFEPIATLFSFLLIILLVIFAFICARKYRIQSFCILWVFINLMIESSVIGLELIFEHRLYIPIFGFSLFSSFLIFQFLNQSPVRSKIICLMLVFFLGGATYIRNNVWQNEITLWSDVLSKNPQSFRAHYNIGNSYKKIGDVNSAVKHYIFAINIRPTHAKAHNNLANIFKQEGLINKALFHYKKALEINHNDPVTHYNIGNLMAFNDDLETARHHLNHAIKLNRQYAKAHNNLGIVYARLDKPDKAIKHFTEAVHIESNYADPILNLVRAHLLNDNLDAACHNYSLIMKIDPGHPITQNKDLIECQ